MAKRAQYWSQEKTPEPFPWDLKGSGGKALGHCSETIPPTVRILCVIIAPKILFRLIFPLRVCPVGKTKRGSRHIECPHNLRRRAVCNCV